MAEQVEIIGSFGHAGLAVAAPVVAHQAKVLGEFGGLVVPHVQVGAERIRQHQHGRAIAALDLDIDRAAVDIDHRHEIPPSVPDFACFGAASGDTLKTLRARCKALFSGRPRA